jgi:ephrin-B
MEFQPGEDYYFISTSAKGDLYRRVGGHCSSHHMKMAFKVANNQVGALSFGR